MGWDSTTGILTAPFTKIAANGQGDLQKALASSKMSHIELFALDYNRWAKFKPFRNANIYHDRYGDSNSARLAGLKAANFGLGVVDCGRVDYPSKYSNRWALNKPVVPTYVLRALDFDGYQKNCWWQLGSMAGGRMYATIFNGMLSIPGTMVSDLDTISFDMQCRENDDADAHLGLLYPYDFAGAGLDISQYYIGLAIIDSGSNIWVISGPKVSDYYSGVNVYTGIRATIINSISNGALIVAPVLLQNHTIPSGQSEPQWTNGYNGTIVNLDGAYLSANKVAQTANLLTNVTFSLDSSSITLNFSISNQTGSAVTINNLYCYLLSAAAEANEHDSGYSGPDYMGEGVKAYIERTWPGSYKQGDIYSHDWNGGSTNPDQLAARAYNAYSDFFVANNYSNVIGNNTTRTWSKTFNYTQDDFGSYANGAVAMLCLAPTNNSYVREYFSI